MLFHPLHSIRLSGHRRATHRPLVNLAEPQGADPRTASHIVHRRHADRHQRNTAHHRYRSRQAPRLDREPFALCAVRDWTARGEGAQPGAPPSQPRHRGGRIVLEHAPHTGADANISSHADLQPPHINLSPLTLETPQRPNLPPPPSRGECQASPTVGHEPPLRTERFCHCSLRSASFALKLSGGVSRGLIFPSQS